jgi:acid phosphatase
MKTAILGFVLILLALPSLGREAARPQMNLGVLKQECVKYHDSGMYEADIDRVDREAEAELERRRGVPSRAVVLDIDETSLSNWGILRKLDFGFIPAEFDQWCKEKKAPAIPPTLRLFNHARALGYEVFFITGRRDEPGQREVTVDDLRAAGYQGWKNLYLAPAGYKAPSIAPFKTSSRRAITQEGWRILVNVGDQESDLAGGYGERRFKLPNPMYLVP